MKKIAGSAFLILLFCSKSFSQNIFPQVVEGCELSQFCLDCGEPKATFELSAFTLAIDSLNKHYNFKGGRGKVGFQVLVSADGKGCVISHTDQSSGPLTKEIIRHLNSLPWVAAVENNKAVNASINVFLEVANDRLVGKIERVNIEEFGNNMSNPGEPEIYNKHYKYTNPTLQHYEVLVWQRENSNLPHNMSTNGIVDKNGYVWYATYNGFTFFDGQQVVRLNEKNSPFKKDVSVRAVAVDAANNKWAFANNALFKYNNKEWNKVTLPVPLQDVSAITTSAVGEVFVASDTGLLIIKNGKTEVVNQNKIKTLPSNAIFYGYRDKKGRLWIGTFKGSVMIEPNGKVVTFQNGATPLQSTTITQIAEDEKGNLYFALYAFNDNGHRNKTKEGFAVLTTEGQWKHYNDENSGLPANHVNALLYDRFENVLWIGTNEAGLVRFDLKDGWENYHNLNSKVPSAYIFELSQDSKGNIYAATFNGMMRIRKK